LMNSVQAATTTLLDPATLAIGTKVGENLQVFGVCPTSNKNCLPEEKVKYVSAVAGRLGKIEFDVNITDNFELDVNVNWHNPNTQAITLYKTPNDDKDALIVIYNSYISFKFNHDYRINGSSSVGWDNGEINNVELLSANGGANLNINGVPFRDLGENVGVPMNLDTSHPFVKLVITGIQPSDKLYEITLKGGNSTTTPTTPTTPTVPTTPTTPVTTSSSSSDNCGIAKYTSTTGLFNVPCVAVPIVSAFSSAQIAVYSVQMQQQAGKFTFDLNLSSVKQRMMITILKQYLVGTQTCNDLRVDTFDDSGLIIASSENKTTCE